MDAAQKREALAKQAATLVVVMVSFVASRIRRSILEPNPMLYQVKCVADQHRQCTLQAIYKSTDRECLSMIRMTRAPFLVCVTCLDIGALFLRLQVAVWRSRLLCSST
jgi:siroheme synthase